MSYQNRNFAVGIGSFVLRQQKSTHHSLQYYSILKPHALTFLLPRYRINWSAVPASSDCFTEGGFMYRLRDVKVFKSSTLVLGCTSTADWPSNIMETWIWSYKIISLKVICRKWYSAFPWFPKGFPHSWWGSLSSTHFMPFIIIVRVSSLRCVLQWFTERYHNKAQFSRGLIWYAKWVWSGVIFRVFRSGWTVYLCCLCKYFWMIRCTYIN